MASKSFYEVLEDQIRAELKEELRREVESEIARKSASRSTSAAVDSTERIESWLTTRLQKTFFRRAESAKRAYGSPRTQTSTAAAPKMISAAPAKTNEATLSVSTPEELFAAELLSRYSGTELGSTFPVSVLKLAWRRAALKTHPDRYTQSDLTTQTRANALFRELVQAYEVLIAKAA